MFLRVATWNCETFAPTNTPPALRFPRGEIPKGGFAGGAWSSTGGDLLDPGRAREKYPVAFAARESLGLRGAALRGQASGHRRASNTGGRERG
ncbi:hypothetical protein [Pararhodobacter sp. SW119]|uniref:hypothetical protein n=1 Tax=Pararhodobacter sp. SW119 TaxID=2780075 RepID=UPI001ADFE8BB|nr:hypothetical protein [Pararhodobacter sp. SW119]